MFSALIGELEGTKLQQESLIKEQKAEIDRLKDRLQWLESERHSLEHEKSSLSQQQAIKLKSLERVSIIIAEKEITASLPARDW